MDLLKTPSIQSLLDSDLESVGSLHYVDIEELDEVEYALPASEALTLDEVLTAEDTEIGESEKHICEKPSTCSALQVDFLQAISQQIIQAQERSQAGAATALSVGCNGKTTVGTAHGHLLSFQDQILRWVCDLNEDCGAVTCLAYNNDSTRLLVGYARGLVFQYESIKGIILRRVTLGGETWGALRITWAGKSGLALDTGGSVWLMKFSRPLGVRSVRVSCLFSGARGEVVAMSALDARILALATLTRIIIVAGGRAAGVRLEGPPDTLPVLEWCEIDNRLLVCARANLMQWLSINVTGTTISLRPVQKVELIASPLWMGWLGGTLAIFDANESLRLWGDDYDKPLDLSHIEAVYSSAFFKGLWTDGRVSLAMSKAGESALGGICISEGSLSLLGRKGIVRVRARDILARTETFIASGQYLQALRLLCSSHGQKAKHLVDAFIHILSDRPHILSDKNVAVQAIKLCLKYKLNEELWSILWENCSCEKSFVEALGDSIVRGELSDTPPTPDYTQELIEKLADFEPDLVERVVASLPLTSLDPHRASVFTREKGLWRGVGAIAAALDGSSGAMRTLTSYVREGCAGRAGGRCACAGGALLLTAADALAGRAAAGRPLPEHARPLARHDALHALLTEVNGLNIKTATGTPPMTLSRIFRDNVIGILRWKVESSRPLSTPALGMVAGGSSPLQALVRHDTAATVRLLEQSARDAPFAGPLAKQNRLRVARALLTLTPTLQDSASRIEILEFLSGQLQSGALPLDQEVIKGVQELATTCDGERSDRAWLALLRRLRSQRDHSLTKYRDLIARPRIKWHFDVLLDCHEKALEEFFKIENPSSVDMEELFEYIRSRFEIDPSIKVRLQPYLQSLIKLRPQASAALIKDHYEDSISLILSSLEGEVVLQFGECLLDMACLRGDAAALYLRHLCTMRPADVKKFLDNSTGIVRPEDALEIVRELGPPEAVPACLEATGDPSAALDALLDLIATGDHSPDSEAQLIGAACELCARAAAGAPAAACADMWARLLRRARRVPPASLFAAVACLPPGELLAKACGSASAARALLASGAARRRAWASARRAAQREAHGALARAAAAARRALPVRAACQRCARALPERGAARTTHCARAVHADCDSDATCQICGKRVPSTIFVLPPLCPRPAISIPQEHPLLLIAPPRPDLEGVA